jgi:hypothetical protein
MKGEVISQNFVSFFHIPRRPEIRGAGLSFVLADLRKRFFEI